MSTSRLDITIDSGASFRTRIIIKDTVGISKNALDRMTAAELAALPGVDLTGSTTSADIRSRAPDTTEIGTFTIQNKDDLNGEFDLFLSAAETMAMEFNEAVYSVLTTFPSGDVLRYVEGTVTFSQNVTR